MMGVEAGIEGLKGKGSMMSSESSTPEPSATTESVTESKPAESSGSVEAKPQDVKVSDKPVIGADGKPAAPNPYTPNYKFLHQEKEVEFDDWIKSAIKDADTEKKARELFQRAYGLEAAKEDRRLASTQLKEIQQKYNQTEQAIEKLASYAKNKDWDSFFESLAIPKEDILRYSLDIVKRDNMSPEQKAQYEAEKQYRQQASYYEQQYNQLLESNKQMAVQQRHSQLQQELSKQESKQFAQAYDQTVGQQGAFEDYVISVGRYFAQQGNDIPVSEAVAIATQQIRKINPTLGMEIQQAPMPSQGQNVVEAKQKPVLPNIKGRGTSAVKSSYRSLDELKQKAKELANY